MWIDLEKAAFKRLLFCLDKRESCLLLAEFELYLDKDTSQNPNFVAILCLNVLRVCARENYPYIGCIYCVKIFCLSLCGALVLGASVFAPCLA